ncbi:MAG: TolC family protein [Gammaproteobacteria bacterium]
MKPYLNFLAIGLAAGLFHSPVDASADMFYDGDTTLSAHTLVNAVLERNAGLAAMRAAVDEANARIDPAGSFSDPMLTLGVAPNTIGNNALGTRGQIYISQALPWRGILRARENEARAEANAVSQDEESLRLMLRAMALSQFAEWVLVHQALDINAEHQAVLSELRNVAEARYAAGRAPQQDALQAEVERVRLKQQALELERRRIATQAQVNALLNRAPGSFIPPPELLPTSNFLPELNALIEQAQRSHPELARAEFQQRAAESRLYAEEKLRFPQFQVNAGYNGVLDPVAKRAILGVSINVPLNQSKRRAAINAARAKVRRTEWLVTDRRATLLAELSTDYAAVIESGQSLLLLENELLPLAKETLAVSRADYAAGRGDFLNVVTAERNLLDTELGLVRTQADHLVRLAILERSSGVTVIDLAGFPEVRQ